MSSTHTTTVQQAERSARARHKHLAQHAKAKRIARILINALAPDVNGERVEITVELIPDLPADVWAMVLTIYRRRYAPTCTGISRDTRKLVASYYRQVEAEAAADAARVTPADPFAGVA